VNTITPFHKTPTAFLSLTYGLGEFILSLRPGLGTIEELLEEYTSLEREDILTCLDYAVSLAEEQVTPIEALASAV